MRGIRSEIGSPIFMAREQPGSSAEIKSRPKPTLAEFYKFCADNPDLRIELDKNKTIIIMPPVSQDGGFREISVSYYLFNWWITHKKGLVYSSATAFTLPDGSVRGADGAWASAEKVAALSAAEREKFAHLVPDFIIEVRSTSDRIGKLKQKMADSWIKNGVRLGWLIDPMSEKAWIYRADGSVEELTDFSRTLSGEDVCPGLKFELNRLKIG